MTTNQDLLRKADIALTDLSSNGGLLNPEQTDQFVRTLMDQPTIINVCRVVTMNSPTRKINKLGFGSRILRVATQAQTDLPDRWLSANDRVKPDLSQIRLDTSEVIAEIHIPYEVMEDNIERGNINAAMGQSAGGIMQTIVDMIAERAALDLEELAILGDTSSGDPYLALQDGFLKRASVHIVNAGNQTINKNVLKAGVKAMPTKYLRNRAQLTHFVSINNDTEYRDTYASRQTALGDAMLQGTGPVFAWGSQLQGVPLMPNNTGLFTNPLNLIFGIQRRVTIEYDKDIRAREFIIVLTARIATQVEQTDAVVKYTNING